MQGRATPHLGELRGRRCLCISDRAAAVARADATVLRATVVRAQQPRQPRRAIEAIRWRTAPSGFVGGHCAQNSWSRKAAMGVLQAGRGVLLRAARR